MQKLFDRLTSAALVLAAAAVCALCGTPRQFDEPADNENEADTADTADTADDDLPTDEGEPVAQDDDDDDDLTYAFYVALPLPSDSALGVPLPPSIALVAPWQAQVKERRNG